VLERPPQPLVPLQAGQVHGRGQELDVVNHTIPVKVGTLEELLQGQRGERSSLSSMTVSQGPACTQPTSVWEVVEGNQWGVLTGIQRDLWTQGMYRGR
jgi:hypothetical protein